MSLFRSQKQLMSAFRISYFPHFNAVVSRCVNNPALLPDNLRLFGNNGRLFCVGKYFEKNLKKVL